MRARLTKRMLSALLIMANFLLSWATLRHPDHGQAVVAAGAHGSTILGGNDCTEVEITAQSQGRGGACPIHRCSALPDDRCVDTQQSQVERPTGGVLRDGDAIASSTRGC